MKNKLQRRQEGIKKVRKVLHVWRAGKLGQDEEYYKDGGLGEHHLLKNRKKCSCHMCCNRREMEGETRKEIISKEEMKYEIREELGL